MWNIAQRNVRICWELFFVSIWRIFAICLYYSYKCFIYSLFVDNILHKICHFHQQQKIMIEQTFFKVSNGYDCIEFYSFKNLFFFCQNLFALYLHRTPENIRKLQGNHSRCLLSVKQRFSSPMNVCMSILIL